MKEFRVPRPDKESLDFQLVFDKRIDGEWVEQSEKFKARGNVPGNLLVSLTASMNASEGMQAQELQRLLGQSMEPEYKARFFEVLDDPDTAVPIETLGEILEWLAGEYSGRPTLKS
jgi:hypothetical protein